MKGEARSGDGIPLRFEAGGSGAKALVFVPAGADAELVDRVADGISASPPEIAIEVADHFNRPLAGAIEGFKG
jgi:hypothetical protein